MEHLLNMSLECYYGASPLSPSCGKLQMVPFVGCPVHIPDIVNQSVGTYISEMNFDILAKFSEAKKVKKRP
jgi:hypothetical protein